MQIVIKPFDTLFFRDGKPFEMGIENIANTLSYINPSTIYGAIRRAYFSQKNINFYSLMEEDDPTKDLKIKKVLIRYSKTNYLPIPSDIFENKDSKNREKVLLRNEKISFISNYKFENVFINDNNSIFLKEFNGFIKLIKLKKYLNNPKEFEKELESSKEKMFLDFREMFKNEYKLGIGIKDIQGSVDEGKLYRINLLRFLENVRIIVEFEGIDEFEEKGYLKLGGEGKVVYYEKGVKDINFGNIQFNEEENLFKLYLLTPAIFKNDYIPEWIDNLTLEGEKGNLKLKLISLVMKKTISLGGWNKNKPRSLKKVVPAGSIYIFKVLEGNIKDTIKIFNLNSICDDEQLRKEGFGITIVGRVL